MKSFRLKELELAIADEIMQGAEQLQSELEHIHEVEKGLWQPVAALGGCMPEVLISRNRVKEWTCDCGEADEQPCKHVAALLLRRLEWLKAEEASKKKKPARMNIRKLLDQLEHDDLVTFVQSYARTNKQFNVALKAHFADRFETVSSREKYESLLTAAYRSAKGRSRYLRASRVRTFMKMTSQMIPQTQDLIAAGSYNEAYELIISILKLVPEWLQSADDRQDLMYDFVIDAFGLFIQLSNQELPPSLHDSILAELFELSKESEVSNLWNFQLNYFIPIQNLIETASQRKQALELFSSYVSRNIDYKGVGGSFVLDYYHVLLLDNPEQATRFLMQYSGKPEIRLVLIEEAIKNEQSQVLEELTADLPQMVHLFKEAQLRQLTKLLGKEIEQSKQQQAIQQSLLFRTGSSSDLSAYLSKFESTEKKERLDYLISFFERQHSEVAEKLLPHLYYKAELPEKLMNHIVSRRSLTTLQEFVVQLLAYDYEAALECSKQTLSGYVQNNVGEENAERVKKIIAHLYNTKQRKAGQQLYEFLLQEFKHRDIFVSVLKR